MHYPSWRIVKGLGQPWGSHHLQYLKATMRETMGEAVEERKNLRLLQNLLATIVISLKAQQPLQIVRPRLARFTALMDILAHVS